MKITNEEYLNRLNDALRQYEKMRDTNNRKILNLEDANKMIGQEILKIKIEIIKAELGPEKCKEYGI